MIELAATLALATATCGMDDAGLLRPAQFNRAYENRALAIIVAGQRFDLDRLADWVDPHAKIELQAHIYEHFVGANGLVDFVKRFESAYFAVDRTHSFNVPPSPSICNPTAVSIEFLTSDRTSAMRIEFWFENGVLASAKAFRKSFRVGNMPIGSHAE